MLLAIDCGNTTTVFGLFADGNLTAEGRFRTSEIGTSAECAMALDWFLKRHAFKRAEIKAIVIGSVVPHLTGQLAEMARSYYGLKPVVVTGISPLGIKILYDNPKEVGTDRVVGALAAYRLYGGPCIVIDFGTATTFDIITEAGEYLGGVICPGIETSARSLSNRAAQLFNVEPSPPPDIIGRTTEDSIKSGLFYGTVAMVEGFVLKITEKLQKKFKVIATGGLADMVAGHTEVIDAVNKSLVLEGLAMANEIIRKNAPK
jgi:type III pantothenate kinase